MTEFTTARLPEKLPAGDSLNRTFVLADYPASAGWVLSFSLVSSSALISLTATGTAEGHVLELGASTTAAYAPGTYSWSAYVSRAAERFTVATGRIEVLRNLAASTAGADLRTHARRTLDAIEATIEGRASSDVLSYEIAGRSLSKIPVAELLNLRDRYRRDVRAEEAAEAAASGRLPRNKIYTRL